MTNSADPDQLASDLSGSTLFEKARRIRVQQDKNKISLQIYVIRHQISDTF